MPNKEKVVAKSKLANESSDTIEVVCDESDVYIRMPSMGKWYRKSLSSYDNTVSKSTNHASRYLRMMKKDKVDCDISSKGGSYILTFNAGKKFTDELKKDVFKQMSSTGTVRI